MIAKTRIGLEKELPEVIGRVGPEKEDLIAVDVEG
jgi:hypothetical protein